MLEVRVIRACMGHFRYRVPRASRGRQEPPQAVKSPPWVALGPPVCGVPGGQALRYGTRAPAHSQALNAPWHHPLPLTLRCAQVAVERTACDELLWCGVPKGEIRFT